MMIGVEDADVFPSFHYYKLYALRGACWRTASGITQSLLSKHFCIALCYTLITDVLLVSLPDHYFLFPSHSGHRINTFIVLYKDSTDLFIDTVYINTCKKCMCLIISHKSRVYRAYLSAFKKKDVFLFISEEWQIIQYNQEKTYKYWSKNELSVTLHLHKCHLRVCCLNWGCWTYC